MSKPEALTTTAPNVRGGAPPGEWFASTVGLVDDLEMRRLDVGSRLEPGRRSELGQFFTPRAISLFMASMFPSTSRPVRLLDAGAGVGSLFGAFTAEMCKRSSHPSRIEVVGFEVDELMQRQLNRTLEGCRDEATALGIEFSGAIVLDDFIRCTVNQLDPGLFGGQERLPSFTHAILNPPYKKLGSDSEARHALRRVGIETSNLYTAFLALAVRLLEPGGELVAITPRSFCNGPYFKPFREQFLADVSLKRIHIFDSRTAAFSDDEVLQENVIFHVAKGPQQPRVVISSSSGPDDDLVATREVPFENIVRPGDPDRFIHVVLDDLGEQVANRFHRLTASLPELGLGVSTGKVVDFRAKAFLRAQPEDGDGPLIYPTHFDDGAIRWPKDGKKPNALVDAPETQDLWMPAGTYVLVKRFSSKEERRRVVAAVFDSDLVPCGKVGFENHLNVFHGGGKGLRKDLARGLTAFLNSTLVDTYFRQFNGHTQVNATDLRNLRYPSLETLQALGRTVDERSCSQAELDALVEGIVNSGGKSDTPDPIKAKKHIDDSLGVLKTLGLPKEQQNERSALTLLALLDLKPDTPWAEASDPLVGITPMMTFFSDHFGKTYAPNSRETVRRFTVHQFIEAGLVMANPDKPARPVNSPKAVYQIEPGALALLRLFGSPKWDAAAATYLGTVGSLKTRYEQARQMNRLAVELPAGQVMTLSPGGQNELIKKIIEEFCPRYTPGGHVMYVGDTDEKWATFDEAGLKKLGVRFDSHGKMPDVVVHHVEKNWLLLIEAVTSHGPVNPKRHKELATIFKGSSAGLVYVTTFLSRKAMVKYLGEISWETEVWVAESPDHMIHFNGERFLGPYQGGSSG